MRTALIAGIHANLHALKAVLADIAKAGMDDLVCLGDVVGYGAHPAERIDLLHRVRSKGVMGNHDYYVSSDSPGIELILKEPETATNPIRPLRRRPHPKNPVPHLLHPPWDRGLQSARPTS